MTDIYYPRQYGAGDATKVVHQDYDAATRVSGLKVDGVYYASAITYNAANQATSLLVGTGTNRITESYVYDDATGLLENQTAKRGATTLLDLTYNYVRPAPTAASRSLPGSPII